MLEMNEREGIFIDLMCRRRLDGFAGERKSLTKNGMHLTWKLSDNIAIVLCFDCHVALKLMTSSKENQMLKARTREA